MKVVLSGGGTGGHVYPAIAIANKIKEKNPDAEILFIGTEKGIESDIVPKYGFNIKYIEVQGFRRKIDFENVKRVLKLTKAIKDSKKILKQFKPDLVIGTGGYVSGPVLYAASKMKCRRIIHEQNSFPGITNKILSKKVDKVLTSFDDAQKRFPQEAGKKITLVGNPVRDDIINTTREEARKNLDFDSERKLLLVYGGSGGSEEINTVMRPLVEELIKRDYGFVFATGRPYFDDCMKMLESLELKPYQRVLPYLDDMANVLAASDVVIGSAGAISLAEITAQGKASIIVPKAYTAENHQEFNAMSIQNAGAGVCIKESELNEKTLKETALSLLEDDEKLREMSEASKKLGKPDAIDKIYSEIEKLFA